MYVRKKIVFDERIYYIFQVSAESLKGMTNVKKSNNPGSSNTSADPNMKSNTESTTATAGSPTSTSPTPPSSSSATGELSLSSFMGTIAKDALVSQKSVPIVYSEDGSGGIKTNDMEAKAACNKEDVLYRNWLIRFINSQMLLKGTR